MLFVGLLSLTGCAGREIPQTEVYDPWERFNRGAYAVTDVADRVALRPLARGYAAVVPAPLRAGVGNFFSNLRVPASAVCGLLQGKPARGGTDLARFIVNTTLGIGGLFDVASRAGLPFQDEDLGQVLAAWGYKQSRALYLPVLGPTTVRDLPGDIVNRMLAPRWLLGETYGWELATVDTVSQRASLLTATESRDTAALDPYAFTREANHQRRLDRIYDGSPPVEDFLEMDAADAP